MPCFQHELLLQHSSAQNGPQLSENQVQPCNMKATHIHKLVNSSTHEARVSKNGTFSLFGRNIIVLNISANTMQPQPKLYQLYLTIIPHKYQELRHNQTLKTLHNSLKIHFKTKPNTDTKQQLKLVLQ